jgi:hypothetical protein
MRNLQMLVDAPRVGAARLRHKLKALAEEAGQHVNVLPKAPPVVDLNREEPRLDPTPGTALALSAGCKGLAVCPYCHTVWDLEPIFPEPVKLMICWRCAEQHANAHSAKSEATETPQVSRKRDVRWKVVGACGVLAAAGLTLVFGAMQLRFADTPLGSPRAAGQVSVAPAIGNGAVRTNEAEGAVGPSLAATALNEPPAAGSPACTSGTAALGLCTLATRNERPGP